MPRDTEFVTGGPAKLLLSDAIVGHTEGGIAVSIAPQNRSRMVDEFGSSAVDQIHTGDDITVTAPLTEWTAATLIEVYEPGRDQLTVGSGNAPYLGLGRTGGYVYVAQDLKVTPFLTADANKRIQLFRATSVGEISLNHDADEDRIMSVQFRGLVDDEATDGELIGKMQLHD